MNGNFNGRPLTSAQFRPPLASSSIRWQGRLDTTPQRLNTKALKNESSGFSESLTTPTRSQLTRNNQSPFLKSPFGTQE
jgi:hypothetical protein